MPGAYCCTKSCMFILYVILLNTFAFFATTANLYIGIVQHTVAYKYNTGLTTTILWLYETRLPYLSNYAGHKVSLC